MYIDDHLEPDHAKIHAHVFRDSSFQELVELLINILDLVFEHGLGENILLPDHLGGLFREEFFTALHHVRDLRQDNPVHLFRGDVTAESGIVHYVARLAADERCIRDVAIFIYDETCEKRLAWHGIILCFVVLR
jgi:hypothetical protein